TRWIRTRRPIPKDTKMYKGIRIRRGARARRSGLRRRAATDLRAVLRAAKGALYKPDPLLFPSPHVGVIAMHRNSNYLNHISTKELPARGFVVLGMNPRCDGRGVLSAAR